MNTLLALLLLLAVPAAQQQPDVVIIVLDDVAYTDLAVIPTPNIDALAAQGVTFTRAYAHAWCAPTRDSLLFGEWLGLHRGDACGLPVATTRPLSDLSIGDLMAGHGYATCHIGKWHAGVAPAGPWELAPEMHGFASVRYGRPIGPECNAPGSQVLVVDDGMVSLAAGNDDTLGQRDAFLTWWAEKEGTPRFVVLNPLAGHSPFNYPPAGLLPPGYPHPIPGTNRQKYEAEIVGLDTALGSILAVIPPNAWVILVGDNGTPGAVNGSLGQSATRPDQDPNKVKLSCYEDGIRVPLIIRAPGLLQGAQSAELASVVDILPTLAEALSSASLSVLDGISLLPALKGKPLARDWVFAWNSAGSPVAVVGHRWKLLTDAGGQDHLFDLLRDPRELAPLAPVGIWADKLRAWRESVLRQ